MIVPHTGSCDLKRILPVSGISDTGSRPQSGGARGTHFLPRTIPSLGDQGGYVSVCYFGRFLGLVSPDTGVPVLQSD